MKRILVYVTDHGYGHATREIALVRELAALFPDVEIIIKNSSAFDLISASVPSNVKAIKLVTDVGPTFDPTTYRVNVDATFEKYSSWIDNQEEWLAFESASFRGKPAHLIITDISPIALRLAAKVHCPAVSISNFSWIDILAELPDHPSKLSILSWLRESFSAANYVVKLPFAMRMEGYPTVQKDASILCRNPTKKGVDVRHEIGVGLRDIVVAGYFGLYSIGKIRIYNNEEARVLLLSQYKNSIEGAKLIYRYPETQNIIATSDLVIAKPGHSIVSECAKFRVPIILLPWEYPEGKQLVSETVKLGLSKEITSLSEQTATIEIPGRIEINEMKSRMNEQELKRIQSQKAVSEIVKEFI